MIYCWRQRMFCRNITRGAHHTIKEKGKHESDHMQTLVADAK